MIELKKSKALSIDKKDWNDMEGIAMNNIIKVM